MIDERNITFKFCYPFPVMYSLNIHWNFPEYLKLFNQQMNMGLPIQKLSSWQNFCFTTRFHWQSLAFFILEFGIISSFQRKFRVNCKAHCDRYSLWFYPHLRTNEMKTNHILLVVQVEARRKVAQTVLAFVVIFGICFLPSHIFMLWFYYK